MTRLQIVGVLIFAAVVYLAGVVGSELFPRYDLTVQNGLYSRFDRWTGRVEIATPRRAGAWLRVTPTFEEALQTVRDRNLDFSALDAGTPKPAPAQPSR